MSEQGSSLRDQLEHRLINKSTRDESFRQELLAQPTSVLNRELGEMTDGVRLPDTIEVRVVEETPNLLYLVLPPRFIASEVTELSDEDLAIAAGAGRGGNGTRPGSMCSVGPNHTVTIHMTTIC